MREIQPQSSPCPTRSQLPTAQGQGPDGAHSVLPPLHLVTPPVRALVVALVPVRSLAVVGIVGDLLPGERACKNWVRKRVR